MTESLPPGSPGAATVSIAIPLAFRDELPSAALPFLKVIPPEGSVPVTFSVAVRVIALPYVVVAAGVVNVSVGTCVLTVNVNCVEVAAVLFASPE